MKLFRWHFYLFLWLGFLWTLPRASAVPPPDFIFQVGSQVAYVFSFLALFISAGFSVVLQYLKAKYHHFKLKPWAWALSIALILAMAGGIAYAYSWQQQRADFEAWVTENQDTGGLERPISFHPDLPLSISNEDFQALLDSGSDDFLVVDARENLEYSYGYFPGSVHLRYADILAKDLSTLPGNKTLYVLCWSGMRGEEVALLLREQGRDAIYLEDGASGWVNDFGGQWEGEIMFGNVYPDSEYGTYYGTSETRAYLEEGVILVDAREPTIIAEDPIPGAYEMPLMHTVTGELEAMYEQIPPESTVITICDAWVNCFMAKLVGVELEQRGHTFLGRYNKPWEW